MAVEPSGRAGPMNRLGCLDEAFAGRTAAYGRADFGTQIQSSPRSAARRMRALGHACACSVRLGGRHMPNEKSRACNPDRAGRR